MKSIKYLIFFFLGMVAGIAVYHVLGKSEPLNQSITAEKPEPFQTWDEFVRADNGRDAWIESVKTENANSKNEILNKPVTEEMQNADAPLSEAHISDKELTTWAIAAASETLTFNFNDHEKALLRAKRNFTQQGWSEFETALKKERIIEMVEANFHVVSARLKTFPNLISSGVENGTYKWVIKIPLAVEFILQERVRRSDPYITVTIIRADKSVYPDGLAIDKWDGMPR